jgi:hypothetical protein
MTATQPTHSSLLRWAAQEKWDWLMALPISKHERPQMAEMNFWPWIRAIERLDATWSFRFMRFKRIGRIVSVNEVDEFLVLLGGLGSGEWRYWSLQWAARNDRPEVRGRKLWGARDNKPLGPILKKHCGEGQFVIHVQHGPKELGYERHMKVDEKGIPYDPKLRKALKRGLRAAERIALQPSPGIVVMPNGTRWQSALDFKG